MAQHIACIADVIERAKRDVNAIGDEAARWRFIVGPGQYNKSMHASRRFAIWARIATLWLLATCAGCWEKIEYKGIAKPPATQAGATTATPRESGGQAAEAATEPKSTAVAVGPASPSAEDVATTPAPLEIVPGPAVPPASDASAPPTDDRYAVAATPPADKPLDSTAVPPAADGATTSPDVASTTTSEGDAAASTTAAETAASPSTTSAAPSSEAGDRYATSSRAGGAAPETSIASPPATTPSPGEAAAAAAGAAAPTTTSPPPTAAVTSESSAPKLSSRRAAWLLGSRLALAALAHDRGVAQDKVPIWFADAQTAAKLLGTSFGELPEPASAGDEKVPASRQVVNYLLVNGQRIGHDLAKQHGVEDASLFEVALKSNILLLLYTPSGTAGESIAAAIAQAAPRAKLPAELWQPLVETLGKKAPQTDVRAAVRKMHTDVDLYLASAAGQGS